MKFGNTFPILLVAVLARTFALEDVPLPPGAPTAPAPGPIPAPTITPAAAPVQPIVVQPRPVAGTPAPAPVITPAPVQPTFLQPQTIAATPTVGGAISGVPLTWDSTAKEYSAKTGEASADFTFHLTNSSPGEVVINWVRTSCGCTVAKLPATPWKIGSGTNGQIGVSVDLRGKFGIITKFITVDTSHGPQMLSVKVDIPQQAIPQFPPIMDARTRNMQMALADRQAVFKNDCATCHVLPALGKKGEPLYQAACAVCHEAPHRATMVPDLQAQALKLSPTRDYWTQWITHGKPGSLMPAFAQSEGGPLTPDQIASLTEYLTHYFPPRQIRPDATPAVDD